jgi:para-nitrobenzyl esterase
MPEPAYPGDSFLVVNVFTPRTDGPADLPVLFFVHGGGFVGGSASSPWYDGAAFNRDEVVTVSVSYRFGFEGFGWIDGATNNRAIRDILLGLEWVRDNIARFCGDPFRVTLAGQSAGAVAGYGVLATREADDLFQRAWMISGRPLAMMPDDAQSLGRKIAEIAGVEPTVDGYTSIPGRRLLGLQADAVSSLNGERTELEILRALGEGNMRFGPVVDGELIRQPIAEALANGSAASKPLVLGTNDHEFNDFADGHAAAIERVGREGILAELGVSDRVADRYGKAYEELDGVALVGQWVTDNRYRRPVAELANRRAAVDAPTWLYRFTWPSPVYGRALHCVDLPFFFDCLEADGVEAIAGAEPPAALAEALHGAITAFVTSGEPGWGRYAGAGCTGLFGLRLTTEHGGYRYARVLEDSAS